MKLANASSSSRYRQLDAVRGIAALIVVFNHYLQSIPEEVRAATAHVDGWLGSTGWATPWPWLRFTPLRLLVNGHAAVVIFFLLSGFVLALPVTRDAQPQFSCFLIKRICRVFIPFAAVILLVWMAFTVFSLEPSPSASDWFNARIGGLTNASLLDHVLMNGHDIRLNPVMWSLVHEMRMVLFMPLIFLAIRFCGAIPTLCCVVGLSLACCLNLGDSNSNTGWQATAHFAWLFAAGSGLAFHRTRISVLFSACRATTSVVLWLLALGLLIVPFDRNWSDFLIGGGAILLIVLCLQDGRMTAVLSARIPIWLGRVSYSLYLIHLPILILILGSTHLPRVLILLATFVCAELAYRWIEAPAHAIGIRAAHRLQQRWVAEQ